MIKDKIEKLLEDVQATDLDGTLAYYTGYKGPTQIGKAIPKHLARVKQWIKDGDTVIVFTARANLPGFKPALRKWLKENDLPEDLEITNIKKINIDKFWDDRAIHVRKNTGEIVG
jgi:hypothetical protein